MVAIYSGDDTNAFGGSFITINIGTIPTGYTVSKAKFQVGDLPVMVFDSPTFPLTVNLTATQTAQLEEQNECHLALYDNNNKKLTCKGTLRFIVKESVVD